MTGPAPIATPAAGPASPAAAAPALRGAREAGGADGRVAEAARAFEGVFMSMLVEEMFSGTELAAAQPVYGGLMTQKFGDALAESGGIGLAAMLTRQAEGAS